MINISGLDLTIVILYLAATSAIGFFFARTNKGTEEYFAGGRGHHGWLLGLSLVGYSISSVTFIALPADTYKTAWLRALPYFMVPVAVLIAAVYFIPLFRKARVTSAYEYLETRFGPGVRLYAACMFGIGQLIRLGVVLYLLAAIVHAMTSLDPAVCIVIAGVITLVYTLTGGLDAVIWTDAIQAVVLIGGGIVLLWTILANIPGGLGQVFSVAWVDNKLSFADMVDGRLVDTTWWPNFFAKSASLMLVVGLNGRLEEYISNQNVVQRYVAAKSTAEARKSLIILGTMTIPIWLLFMFIGTALYVLYQIHPDPAAHDMLTGAKKAEGILPYFLTRQLPAGMVGLIIAGILAAAMSSLSSSMNAFSSVAVVDVYRRLLVPGREDRHYLKAGWVFTILSGIAMIAGALALLRAPTTTMNDAMTIILGLTGGGMLGLFLMGFICKRAGSRSITFGIGTAMIFNLWCILSTATDLVPHAVRSPIDNYYAAFLSNVLMMGVGYAASLLLPEGKNRATPPRAVSAGGSNAELKG